MRELSICFTLLFTYICQPDPLLSFIMMIALGRVFVFRISLSTIISPPITMSDWTHSVANVDAISLYLSVLWDSGRDDGNWYTIRPKNTLLVVFVIFVMLSWTFRMRCAIFSLIELIYVLSQDISYLSTS